MSIRIYLLGISLTLSIFIQGQTITVLDRITLKPIEDVWVTGPEKPVLTTDGKGQVSIAALSGSKEIYIRHIGYNPITTQILALARDGYIVYMRPSANTLDEVVVSPTRFKEKVADVPQKLELIKSSDIQFMNQATTADMLINSGTVFAQKSQMGGGSPVIRGFEASRVLIVVDGIRLNNAIYRTGHLQNVLSVDQNMLDKTEVFFGPGSVTYGSDALGGVMHFYTRNPLLSKSDTTLMKINAAARYATAAGEKMTHIDMNFGNKKWASLTGLTLNAFSDLRTGSKRDSLYGDWGKKTFYVDRIENRDTMLPNDDPNVQSPSGYTQFDFMQKILFQPNRKHSHLLNFQFSTTTNIPRYDRLTILRNNLPRFSEWYYGPQKRMLAAYTYNFKIMKRLADEGRFTAAYQQVEESRHDRAFQNPTLFSRIENVKVLTINLDFERRIEKHEFSYGIDGGYNRVNSSAFTTNIIDFTTGPLDTRYPDGGSDWFYAALFATHKFELSDKWVISDGLRISHTRLKSVFNDTSFYRFPFKEIEQRHEAINGNIGVVYHPDKWWKYSFVIASGFRAPNVDDLSKIFESVAGTVILPNPNLKPEYTYNADMSMTRLFHDNSFVSLTGFYSHYIRAITLQNGQFNGVDSIFYDGAMSRVQMTTNAGRAFITGISGKLSLELTDRFRLINDISYTYGRIITDSTPYPLDHIPPVFGKTSLLYQQKKLQAECFVLFNGRKKVKDYNMLGEDNFGQATPFGTPAWMTLNLRFGYQINKSLQLQAGCENIADRHYRYFASGISAPGRNLFVTMRGSL